MNYDIRNVLSDKKKLTIIAGVTVVGLSIGSVGLKLHKEHTNPSTPPVSADEVDVKDKMISQLRVENRKLKQQLNAQKTKSNNSSNELVPYNLNVNGSLGGRYNSTPLSLGGGYNYTPTLEPTVYEPIVEPVDQPFVEPTPEPIVEETPVEEPNVPVTPSVPESTPTPPEVNEAGIESNEPTPQPVETPPVQDNNGEDVGLPPEVTPPAVTPPPVTPPTLPEEVTEKPIMVVPIEGRNVDDLIQEIKEKELNGREVRVEIVDDAIYFYEII